MSRYYPPVTVTGNPVNFSAPNGGKLDSVSVQIIPTQDLHGYANPWPGGGGVNKFYCANNATATAHGVTCSFDASTQTFTVGGTNDSSSAYVLLNITPTAEIVRNTPISRGFIGAPSGIYANFVYYDGTWHGVNNDGIIPDTVELSNIRVQVGVLGSTTSISSTTFKFQIQEGSTAPTSWSPYSNICPISGRTGLNVYVSPTQDVADATTYSVDWTSQAGTVYGGTVDVVTGVLTVDRVSVNLNPYAKYENANGYYWYTTTSALSIGAISGLNAGLISNRLVAESNITDTTSECKIAFYANGIIRWKEEGSLPLADYRTYLASNPLQIVYELATPITYQLAPKQIAALIDQNYIWSSNNETISVVYALLVPGSDKYTLIVNGVDIADFVERDSYRTTLYPVFSEAVQTLDGVGHTALLRKKGELSARFNPRTAADTAIICAALLNAPCEVQYHCLQRNADVTALMTIDSVSALYLSRCLYCRQKWNDIDSITLTEL